MCGNRMCTKHNKPTPSLLGGSRLTKNNQYRLYPQIGLQDLHLVATEWPPLFLGYMPLQLHCSVSNFMSPQDALPGWVVANRYVCSVYHCPIPSSSSCKLLAISVLTLPCLYGSTSSKS